MTAYFTRAAHPELPEAVMPLDAVGSYPGWTAIGEPADNPDVLYAAIEREQMIAALNSPAASTPPPATPVPTPSASKSGADTSSSAPAGADPKEQ